MTYFLCVPQDIFDSSQISKGRFWMKEIPEMRALTIFKFALKKSVLKIILGFRTTLGHCTPATGMKKGNDCGQTLSLIRTYTYYANMVSV